jgi:hypothetical protein
MTINVVAALPARPLDLELGFKLVPPWLIDQKEHRQTIIPSAENAARLGCLNTDRA